MIAITILFIAFGCGDLLRFLWNTTPVKVEMLLPTLQKVAFMFWIVFPSPFILPISLVIHWIPMQNKICACPQLSAISDFVTNYWVDISC